MAILPQVLRPVIRLSQESAGANPTTWIDVLRHDVIPVLSAFAVWVAILASYGRSTRRDGRTEPMPARRRAFAALVSMVAGGYVVFLAIVVVFYFVLGGEAPSLIWQALGEGSLLAFGIVLPAFLGISWLHERRRPAIRRR